MSGKTWHFDKADERIAQQAIQEGATSPLVEGNESSEDETLLEEELDERFSQLIEEEEDGEEDCFCSGGGCICEEVVHVPQNFKCMDEENLRFGDPLNMADFREEVFGSRTGEKPQVFHSKIRQKSGKAIPKDRALPHF